MTHQCEGLTLKRTRCTRDARPGSNVCRPNYHYGAWEPPRRPELTLIQGGDNPDPNERDPSRKRLYRVLGENLKAAWVGYMTGRKLDAVLSEVTCEPLEEFWIGCAEELVATHERAK